MPIKPPFTLHDYVTFGYDHLPFGPLAAPFQRSRTPAEWALLHSNIEFIEPEWERDCVLLLARNQGWTFERLSRVSGKSVYEIENAVGRVTRTLATWEVNAGKWAHRYVAREPQAYTRDGASERDQYRERGNRRGSLS